MSKRPSSKFVELDALCTIAGAAELLESLKKAFGQAGPITLAAASVVKIDTAALQLLCALVSEAQQRGRQVIWKNPSPAVVESAKILGLSGHLGLEDKDR